MRFPTRVEGKAHLSVTERASPEERGVSVAVGAPLLSSRGIKIRHTRMPFVCVPGQERIHAVEAYSALEVLDAIYQHAFPLRAQLVSYQR